MKHLIAISAAVVVIAWAQMPTGGAAPAGAVTLLPHDIDANFKGGYSVSVADFNKDGRPDVIANSLSASELAWYKIHRGSVTSSSPRRNRS